MNLLNINCWLLPTGFGHTGDLSKQCPPPETNAAHAEFPQERPRPSTHLAPIVTSDLKLWFSFCFGDQRFFCHKNYRWLTHPRRDENYFLKGRPKLLNRHLPSSSVLAEVQMVIFIPLICSTLSKSISGKINCSLTPTV